MQPLIELCDKRIIIVGASKGIGKQTAILLSELGAKCVLISRNQDSLIQVLNEMEGEGHGVVALDLEDTDKIEEAVKLIVNSYGKIDGMAYVAGVTDDRPVRFLKPEFVENIMKINYGGFIEFVRCVSKKNMFNPGMRIVGVSSVAAFAGTKAHTIYSSSKAAMIAAVRCLAQELADKNIAINSVAPGWVKTEMYDKWLDNNGEDSYQACKMKKNQYLGVIEAGDIAKTIAFLLSSASRFIAGTCLIADGGSYSN